MAENLVKYVPHAPLSFRFYKVPLRPRLRPGPRCRSLRRSHIAHTWLRRRIPLPHHGLIL